MIQTKTGIRTTALPTRFHAGEMRISNFLLWQIAYTELWVTPTLWPDFGPADLYHAVAEFQSRTRRFGKV